MLVMNCLVFAEAESEQYQLLHLYDESFIASYETYEQASAALSTNEDAGIFYRGKLIALDRGIVVLNHDNCTVNIDTIYEKTDENGYVNGCYGNDGLYLRTNSTGKWILMMMSGARMWVHRDDVTLVPYSEDLMLSSYFVSDDRLFHQIKTRWKSNEYGSLVDLGTAPSELKEGTNYLSYDGHYFYHDFSLLSLDMKNEIHDHAVNAGNPYYNYFMFLPHRSMSQTDASELNDYFESLCMTSSLNRYDDQNSDSINDVLTRSQLAGALDSFVYAQAEFGSNALLMLALSMNESASGRSSLAYRRNNLFGHSAFDSDVEGNAKRYLSVENSVLSHAKNYISLSYANPEKFTYHGSFFGNKNSGMNVSYASDPYWSEKAASYAFQLDDALGNKESHHYALAIVENEMNLLIFDESLDEVLCKVESIPLMSFVVLDEKEDYYLVQLDENLFSLTSQRGSYDFTKNVGYLRKEDVDRLINPDKIAKKEVVNAVFKASGGVFKDGTDEKVLQFEKGRELVCEAPVQQNAVFEKWNQISETVFEAQYRYIDSIRMHTLPDQVTELNVPLDLSGGSIEVLYENGDREIVELTTSMVFGYSLSEASKQQVNVNYGGASTFYPLRVSLEKDEQRRRMNELMEQALQMNGNDELNEDDVHVLSELKMLFHNEFTPVLTMKQIMNLDRLYHSMMKDDVSVIVGKNDVNLSLSGLYLSTQLKENRFPFGKPVIKIELKHQFAADHLKQTAIAQGWKVEDEFVIDFKVNGHSELWETPLLFTMDRPDQNLKEWAVLTSDEADVVQCHTAVYQDRIRFKALKPGSFVLVSKPSVNVYDTAAIEDVTLSIHNGFDYDAFFKIAGLSLIAVLCSLIGWILALKKRLK